MNDMPHRVLTHDTGPPEADRLRPLRTGTFGVVDIGTTKIGCLIARVDSDGALRVLGCDWRQGLGVRGGSIVDLEKAERAIRACVGQAENMADARLRAVIVNLTCGQPDSQHLQCEMVARRAGRGQAGHRSRRPRGAARRPRPVARRRPRTGARHAAELRAGQHRSRRRSARLVLLDIGRAAARDRRVVVVVALAGSLPATLRSGDRVDRFGADGRRHVDTGGRRAGNRRHRDRHGRRHHQRRARSSRIS